jgi:3-mercaptopyruvate sulfurtransferase SseA
MTRRSPDPRLRLLPLTVAGLGLILLVGTTFLLLRPSAEPVPTEQSPQILSPESIPRVNLPDARQAYESGAAIFVDVRDESSFKSGHISGALSIPLSALPDREGELDPNAWIITYCT